MSQALPSAGRLSPVLRERREVDLGVAGVGGVVGLAVAAERLLGQALGVSDRLRAFRPSVPLAVQRDAFDSEVPAALLDFRGAIEGPDAEQIGEGRAGGRDLAKDPIHVFAKADQGGEFVFQRRYGTIRRSQSMS